MTAIAQDEEKLRELEAGTRRAWTAYSESLRSLRGEEYERVEEQCWMELQAELRRIRRRRQVLGYNRSV